MALALAHAECGNFTEAIKLGKKAAEMLERDSTRAREYREIVKAFEQGKPWRFDSSVRSFAR
jgi:hypothetical protein